MPFRAKLKKALSSKKTTPVDTTASDDIYPPRRSDIEYYEPHEIPHSKYRGRVDPKHQETLNSFTFTDSFASARRSSAALSGTFSPGGTNAQSRRPSYISRPNSSYGTTNTLSTLDSDESQRTANGDDDQDEDDDDDNASDTSASTSDDATLAGSYHDDTLASLHKRASTYKHNVPFTAEQLEQAMSRVSLDPRPTLLVTAPPAVVA